MNGQHLQRAHLLMELCNARETGVLGALAGQLRTMGLANTLGWLAQKSNGQSRDSQAAGDLLKHLWSELRPAALADLAPQQAAQGIDGLPRATLLQLERRALHLIQAIDLDFRTRKDP